MNNFLEIKAFLIQTFVYFYNLKIAVVDGEAIKVSNLILGILLFLVSNYLFKKIKPKLRKFLSNNFEEEIDNVYFIEKLITYFFYIIIFTTILQVANIPMKSFAFIGGAFALGLGYGAQNIFRNFISGLIILFEKPISVGDYIEIGLVKGVVKSIGARCTTIKSDNNSSIIIPNSTIIEQNLKNFSKTRRNNIFDLNIKFAKSNLNNEIFNSDSNLLDSFFVNKIEEANKKILNNFKNVRITYVFHDITSLHIIYRVSFFYKNNDAISLSNLRDIINQSFFSLLCDIAYEIEYI